MDRMNTPVVFERNVLEPVQQFTAPPGLTITEILHLAKVPEPIFNNVMIVMNGVEVARDQWCRVEPREDDVLAIHVIPLGGSDGKSILRLIAIVAISIAAVPLATAALASSGLAGTALTAATTGLAAGITMVGALLVNAIIPPPKLETPSQSAAGDAYFINSQQNRARLGETIPVVYGMHKMYGNLATAPDIFSAGTSSIFTALYDWGLGYCDVWDMKAGDTPLNRFPATIRHLKGVPEHFDKQQPLLGLAPVDLELIDYPTKSVELNLALNENADQGSPTTARNSKQAVVELFFPGGLVKYDKQGKEQRNSVQFTGEYRGPGTNYAWTPFPSGTKGYAGDHFSISGGFLNGDSQFPNPNDPASVQIILDKPAYEPGDRVFVRMVFNQPTYFIRPQDDLWFVNSTNGTRERGFDFNEYPNPDDYPDDWVLNDIPDRPALGVFTIVDGREYGFEFIATSRKGYYFARTNMENFKDAPPPDGFSFPAGVVNSQQIAIGSEWDGEILLPPVSSTLYSRDAGNETYLMTIETQAYNGTRGEFYESFTSAELWYHGERYPVTVQLVPEYKGVLKDTEDLDTGYAGVMVRRNYYALKMAPSGVSSYGGVAPAFNINIDGFGEVVTRSSFTVSGNELTPGRVSIVVPFSKEGEYDIRVVRVGDHKDYKGDDRFVENCTWTRLTSRGYPVDEVGNRRGILDLRKKHTMSEVQFQASENIQGNVQQISAMVRSYVRSYGPDGWIEPKAAASSNPAWVALDILTGYSIQNSNDIPVDKDFDGGWISDEQIDFPAFRKFARHCNESVEYYDKYGEKQTRKRYTYHNLIASDAPIIETVNGILSMARAQLIINQQGKVSLMLDSDKDLDGNERVPRQLFTSHNSWGFSAERNFVDLPHALDVSFTDPDLGYQKGVYRVFRPGYNERNSTLFESIATTGCTNWHQAAQWGMYQLASGVLRSEFFTLNCDVENLVVQRGDLVELQHDAPIIGGRSAIVAEAQGTKLRLSEPFGNIDREGYTIRSMDGIIYTGVCAVVGDQVDLDVDRNLVGGEIIVIGTRNEEDRVTERYVIKSVRPKGDLTAELSMALYDPDLYTTDDGGFPSYDPNFSQTDEESGYHVVKIYSGFSDLVIEDRFPYTHATIKWAVEPLDDNVHRFVIEYLKTGSTEKQVVGSVSGSTFQWTHKYATSDKNFGSGIYFVRPLSSLGYYGKGDQIYLSRTNDRTVPHPPTPFYVERLTASDAMRFLWKHQSNDIDIQGYTIFWMPLGSVVFDPAIAKPYLVAEHYQEEGWRDIIKEGTYWIVAVDTSGNESIAAKEAILWTLIQIICGNPDWTGEKRNLITDGEELLLDPDSPSFIISNSPPPDPEIGDLWWKVTWTGEARNGWVGVYEHDEETVLEQPANLMIRSFIQTSTDLEQIVIADPEWNPMSDIDPISWQPDGIDYEVYHEASIDDGPWRRIHNNVVRARRIKYRLVVISYKEQDLRVQRACLHIHSTNNLP